MSIKVYTVTEALQSVLSNPTTAMVAEKKKEDKVYKGTKFLNLFWNIGRDVRKTGWFSFENVNLSIGVADPSDVTDKRNDYDGTRLQLESKISLSGEVGKFLIAVNPLWYSLVEKCVAEGSIVKGSRKVHGLVQTHCSEDNVKTPNAEIEDPIVRFKIDFSSFPNNYPQKFLAGQPKTIIYDYRTEYLDEKGVKQHKIATVINPDTGKEEPVNAANLHLFVTEGSIIRYGRIMVPSISVSQSWISAAMIINKAVIEPGSVSGFSDEVSTTEKINAAFAKAEINEEVKEEAAVGGNVEDNNADPTDEAKANTDIDDILACI